MDWATLFRQTTLAGALREVASSLGARGRPAVSLTVRDPTDDELARLGLDEPRSEAAGRREELRITGSTPWTLEVLWSEARPSDGALEEARAALTAWRAARDELERAERGLDRRTRELRLLQELARSAAEARDAAGLFEKSAAVLCKGGDIEAVAAVWTSGARPEASVHLARPLRPSDAERLVRRAAREIGESEPFVGAIETVFLEHYDQMHGKRSEIRENEWVVVPIRRRGRPAAAVVLLGGAAGDTSRRLAYGAANQLSLHLDRILTVREAERGRFRAILDSMSQAVLLTDQRLKVMQANPAASLLLARLGGGEAPERLASVGDLDLLPLAESLARDPSVPSTPHEARLDDGTILSVTLSGMVGERGRAEGLVIVLADVTETHRMHEQLAQNEKLSSLGQMMSGVAHELNNPLASVTGYAQLARMGSADDQLAKRLEVIDREAQRCRKIVQNLLSFARRHEPESTLLSLNEVVTSTLRLVAYQLRVDNIRVVSTLEPDLAAVEGDPHQLQQALLNLVTNAQHAIEAKGEGGTITVTTRPRDDDRVVLEVGDDGPGIPSATRERIFDPFFTTKPVGQGTGLGLSLVHSIVTAHGGKIRVEGTEGEGATFRIELPAGRRTRAPAEKTSATLATPPTRGGRVLVVDDEEAVARLIEETLVGDGHDVEQTGDREEALALLARHDFDVIVLDLRMPGMADEKFRERLEGAIPELARRLVFVTGDTVSPEPRALAERIDAPVLAKPFDLDDLRRAVRSRLAARNRP